MSTLNITLPIASTQNITDPSLRSKIHTVSKWYNMGNAGCTGFWRDAALVVPSVLFVLYLGFQAKRNLNKLSHRRSYVMISYYALIWFTVLLNLAWSFLQVLYGFMWKFTPLLEWQCDPGKEIAWNILSLFTESGMLFLEISLVAFLLQDSYASGLEALARTFIVSGVFVAVDILLQGIFIFGFGVPLFIDYETTHRGKWGVWFIHTLVLAAAYGYIAFVHYSKWRDKLPPRPAFYNYVILMFIVNVTALFASGLAGIGAAFGLWLYNFIVIVRHSLYLPFLYIIFLADFFQEEDWLLDNAYYSEMKDAGFFDTDWD